MSFWSRALVALAAVAVAAAAHAEAGPLSHLKAGVSWVANANLPPAVDLRAVAKSLGLPPPRQAPSPPTAAPATSPQPLVLRWPVQGALFMTYGEMMSGKPSAGIGIKAPSGAIVTAASDGIVNQIGPTNLTVAIGPYLIEYQGLAAISVHIGQSISQGEPLAEVRHEGANKPSVVFLTVKKQGHYVDPLPLLEAKGGGAP